MTAVGLDREDAYHPAHELGLKMLCAGMFTFRFSHSLASVLIRASIGIANAVGSMVTNPADLTKVCMPASCDLLHKSWCAILTDVYWIHL